MNRLLRNVVSFLWVTGAIGSTQSVDTTTSTGNGHVPTTSSTASTNGSGLSLKALNSTGRCPSRTVNYITHTLAKQCLRTDRVATNSISGSILSGTAVVTSLVTESAGSSGLSTTSTEKEILPTGANNATLALDAVTNPEIQDASSTTTLSASTSINALISEATAEDDAESPLDNANFLSFEDWKKQNLAKTGQSPDDIGNRGQSQNGNRPPPVINNALDTLGEESEIELDFSGFGGVKPSIPESQQGRLSTSSDGLPANQQSTAPSTRSKDAGKTCKERTNYASFDCSATMLKYNKECKSPSSVLIENKDSYMLNTCAVDNKFFIVELCDDIQIDTVVLANYEFFSSSFRHFRVSVSDRYPVRLDKWRDLGTFEARNTREIQAFLIENPLIWAKYMRIEFLTHYGTEYYCPVSVLRVHGTTMIEDYRHQEDLARGEEDEVASPEAEVVAASPEAREPIASPQDSLEEIAQAIPSVDESSSGPAVGDSQVYGSASKERHAETDSSHSTAMRPDETGAIQVGAHELLYVNMTCETPTTAPDTEDTPSSVSRDPIPGVDLAAKDAEFDTANQPETTASLNGTTTATSNDTVPFVNSTQRSTAAGVYDSTERSAQSSTQAVQLSSTNTTTQDTHSASGVYTTSTASSSQTASSANATRSSAPSSTSQQAPQPSTQESFFKSFHKRLQQLESNSTLSLQYIEEQSRILRDAFSKVEKRQVGTTTKFLSQLNATVMAELHSFRQAYDQLWQSTVIELEGQREDYQREMLALSARLTMVADELVWQKRMGIVQSTLLLLCLALVLFGRTGNGYLEVPLMQQMMNKSTAALRGGWDSPPNSPSPDSRSPVSLLRRKIWRSHTEPEPAGGDENSTDSEVSRPQTKEGPEGLDVLAEPPSPDPRGLSDYDDEQNDDSPPGLDRKQRQSPATSPDRSRKKLKKPPGWPQENRRAKSPLAM